jgi:hypothetical protein
MPYRLQFPELKRAGPRGPPTFYRSSMTTVWDSLTDYLGQNMPDYKENLTPFRVAGGEK